MRVIGGMEELSWTRAVPDEVEASDAEAVTEPVAIWLQCDTEQRDMRAQVDAELS
jgi:hypothetical protein